jgi:hypothetical protein
MHVERFENVVAALVPDAPRLVIQVVVLADALDLEPLEVHVVSRDRDAADATGVTDAVEVEDRQLARVSKILDRATRGAVLVQHHAADGGSPTATARGALAVGVGTRSKVHGVARVRRALRLGHRRKGSSLGPGAVVVAGRRRRHIKVCRAHRECDQHTSPSKPCSGATLPLQFSTLSGNLGIRGATRSKPRNRASNRPGLPPFPRGDVLFSARRSDGLPRVRRRCMNHQ